MRYPNVYRVGREIATENLTPGFQVYGEKLVKQNQKELRIWEPRRSKLAAGIMKGIRQTGIKPNDRVLYLGAASGTTSSHVSDIVGKNGYVFCLDMAPRVVRDLIFVTEKRKNMFAILADAGRLEEFSNIVPACDVIYQDIASPNQLEILLKNSRRFLKKGGYAVFAVKSRSIDVTKNPRDIFEKIEKKLKKHFKIIDKKRLEPFEKDHMLFILKK